jgi:hypothetical protein
MRARVYSCMVPAPWGVGDEGLSPKIDDRLRATVALGSDARARVGDVSMAPEAPGMRADCSEAPSAPNKSSGRRSEEDATSCYE